MGAGERRLTGESVSDGDTAFWLAVTLAADARGVEVFAYIREAVGEKILADTIRYSEELTEAERTAIAVDLARAGIIVGPVTDTVH
jgi:hypothetical protein